MAEECRTLAEVYYTSLDLPTLLKLSGIDAHHTDAAHAPHQATVGSAAGTNGSSSSGGAVRQGNAPLGRVPLSPEALAGVLKGIPIPALFGGEGGFAGNGPVSNGSKSRTGGQLGAAGAAAGASSGALRPSEDDAVGDDQGNGIGKQGGGAATAATAAGRNEVPLTRLLLSSAHSIEELVSRVLEVESSGGSRWGCREGVDGAAVAAAAVQAAAALQYELSTGDTSMHQQQQQRHQQEALSRLWSSKEDGLQGACVTARHQQSQQQQQQQEVRKPELDLGRKQSCSASDNLGVQPAAPAGDSSALGANQQDEADYELEAEKSIVEALSAAAAALSSRDMQNGKSTCFGLPGSIHPAAAAAAAKPVGASAAAAAAVPQVTRSASGGPVTQPQDVEALYQFYQAHKTGVRQQLQQQNISPPRVPQPCKVESRGPGVWSPPKCPPGGSFRMARVESKSTREAGRYSSTAGLRSSRGCGIGGGSSSVTPTEPTVVAFGRSMSQGRSSSTASRTRRVGGGVWGGASNGDSSRSSSVPISLRRSAGLRASTGAVLGPPNVSSGSRDELQLRKNQPVHGGAMAKSSNTGSRSLSARQSDGTWGSLPESRRQSSYSDGNNSMGLAVRGAKQQAAAVASASAVAKGLQQVHRRAAGRGSGTSFGCIFKESPRSTNTSPVRGATAAPVARATVPVRSSGSSFGTIFKQSPRSTNVSPVRGANVAATRAAAAAAAPVAAGSASAVQEKAATAAAVSEAVAPGAAAVAAQKAAVAVLANLLSSTTHGNRSLLRGVPASLSAAVNSAIGCLTLQQTTQQQEQTQHHEPPMVQQQQQQQQPGQRGLGCLPQSKQREQQQQQPGQQGLSHLPQSKQQEQQQPQMRFEQQRQPHMRREQQQHPQMQIEQQQHPQMQTEQPQHPQMHIEQQRQQPQMGLEQQQQHLQMQSEQQQHPQMQTEQPQHPQMHIEQQRQQPQMGLEQQQQHPQMQIEQQQQRQQPQEWPHREGCQIQPSQELPHHRQQLQMHAVQPLQRHQPEQQQRRPVPVRALWPTQAQEEHSAVKERQQHQEQQHLKQQQRSQAPLEEQQPTGESIALHCVPAQEQQFAGCVSASTGLPAAKHQQQQQPQQAFVGQAPSMDGEWHQQQQQQHWEQPLPVQQLQQQGARAVGVPACSQPLQAGAVTSQVDSGQALEPLFSGTPSCEPSFQVPAAGAAAVAAASATCHLPRSGDASAAERCTNSALSSNAGCDLVQAQDWGNMSAIAQAAKDRNSHGSYQKQQQEQWESQGQPSQECSGYGSSGGIVQEMQQQENGEQQQYLNQGQLLPYYSGCSSSSGYLHQQQQQQGQGQLSMECSQYSSSGGCLQQQQQAQMSTDCRQYSSVGGFLQQLQQQGQLSQECSGCSSSGGFMQHQLAQQQSSYSSQGYYTAANSAEATSGEASPVAAASPSSTEAGCELCMQMLDELEREVLGGSKASTAAPSPCTQYINPSGVQCNHLAGNAACVVAGSSRTAAVGAVMGSSGESGDAGEAPAAENGAGMVHMSMMQSAAAGAAVLRGAATHTHYQSPGLSAAAAAATAGCAGSGPMLRDPEPGSVLACGAGVAAAESPAGASLSDVIAASLRCLSAAVVPSSAATAAATILESGPAATTAAAAATAVPHVLLPRANLVGTQLTKSPLNITPSSTVSGGSMATAKSSTATAGNAAGLQPAAVKRTSSNGSSSSRWRPPPIQVPGSVSRPSAVGTTPASAGAGSGSALSSSFGAAASHAVVAGSDILPGGSSTLGMQDSSSTVAATAADSAAAGGGGRPHTALPPNPLGQVAAVMKPFSTEAAVEAPTAEGAGVAYTSGSNSSASKQGPSQLDSMDPARLRALLAELQKQRQQAQIQQAQQQQQQLEQAKAWNAQVLQQQQQRRQILQQAARGGIVQLGSPGKNWQFQPPQEQQQQVLGYSQQQQQQWQEPQPLPKQAEGLHHQHQQQETQQGQHVQTDTFHLNEAQHQQQQQPLMSASIASASSMERDAGEEQWRQGVGELLSGKGGVAQVQPGAEQGSQQQEPQQQQQVVEVQPPGSQHQEQQQVHAQMQRAGSVAAVEVAPLPGTTGAEASVSTNPGGGQQSLGGIVDANDGAAAPCKKLWIQPLALQDVLRAQGE